MQFQFRLLKHLNNVYDLAYLIEDRFSRGYAKTVGGFGFGGATVLLCSSGDQMSFYTTVQVSLAFSKSIGSTTFGLFLNN